MALIKFDDDLCARYEQAAAEAHVPLEVLLNRQLARFVDHPSTRRTLVLSGDPLQSLDTILGGGQVKDAPDLLAKVKRWAGITIGNIRIDFSPGQLEEIGIRAAKQGKLPKDLVKDMVSQIANELFYGTVPTR